MGLTASSTALSDPRSSAEGVVAGEAMRPVAAQDGIQDGIQVGVDDLNRKVYCVLGLPIDAIDMSAVVGDIQSAAIRRAPFVLSTPNLNFLVRARTDARFRELVLASDLCPPDGMPLVWIARLTGIPIRRRVAGSDIFDALMAKRASKPLKMFLFGGPDGVAGRASRAINARGRGVACVGAMSPGYGSVEELSRGDVIAQINASEADFLVASLGAQKGQLWLQHNHHRLDVPVRAHLGAVINFQARAIRRAPNWVKTLGLEWLWRIKEEPQLWRRYGHDGLVFLRLLATKVIPLAIGTLWRRLRERLPLGTPQDLLVLKARTADGVTLSLVGTASAQHVERAIRAFREALRGNERIIIDLARTRLIDARFFGLLLMVRKRLIEQGASLKFIGVSSGIERTFRLNGAEFLLSTEDGV